MSFPGSAQQPNAPYVLDRRLNLSVQWLGAASVRCGASLSVSTTSASLRRESSRSVSLSEAGAFLLGRGQPLRHQEVRGGGGRWVASVPRRSFKGGASLKVAQRRKERRFLELVGDRGRAFVVLGEVGGRFSAEMAQFLTGLGSAKVRELLELLRGRRGSAGGALCWFVLSHAFQVMSDHRHTQ